MEIEVTDVSALPETLQGLVAENKLDLSKVVPLSQYEDVQSRYLSTKDEAIANRIASKDWKALGESPSAVAQRIADLEKQAQGTGKGAEDAQAKLDAMKQEYDGKLTAAQERIAKMQQVNAASSLKAELAKIGFIPEAIDDIAATAMARLQFNDDGSPKVLTPDGKPMIGSGADHGATLADLAKELAEAKRYALRDQGKGGSGKQPGTNGGTPAKTVTRAQWDAMDQGERGAHVKSGGKVVD